MGKLLPHLKQKRGGTDVPPLLNIHSVNYLPNNTALAASDAGSTV